MIRTKLNFATGNVEISYASIELEPNVFVVYRTDTNREIYLLQTDIKANKTISLPFKQMDTEEEIKRYGLGMIDLLKNMGGG